MSAWPKHEARRLKGVKRYAERRLLDRKLALTHFAEHLANGLSIQQACDAMGINISTGKSYLREIREGLGPQAV